MLEVVSNIINSAIFSKMGDWVLEFYKVRSARKDKEQDKEKNEPSFITVIIPVSIGEPMPTPPSSTPQASPEQSPQSQPTVILPPHSTSAPSIKDSKPPVKQSQTNVTLPLTEETAEPEFGSSEYLTKLLKAVYKNKRSNESLKIGYGNTDEFREEDNQQ